jgi:hypothetical protein
MEICTCTLKIDDSSTKWRSTLLNLSHFAHQCKSAQPFHYNLIFYWRHFPVQLEKCNFGYKNLKMRFMLKGSIFLLFLINLNLCLLQVRFYFLISTHVSTLCSTVFFFNKDLLMNQSKRGKEKASPDMWRVGAEGS